LELLIGCFLGALPSRRPFADHAQGALEAARPQTPPKFGAVSATVFPLCIEERQIGIQSAFSSPEDVTCPAPDGLADEFAAAAELPRDLFDGHAVLGEFQDCGNGLLPPEIAFILQLFRIGEQGWSDYLHAECGPDRTHGFAHRVEKSGTRILHEVPAIGDLSDAGQCLCGGLAISTAAVSRQDSDFAMPGQPGFNCRDLTVRQEGYNLSSLKIADNRPITMISAESKIVDPDYGERLGCRLGSAPDNAQQGIIAHGNINLRAKLAAGLPPTARPS
jgi:hypothetical protein